MKILIGSYENGIYEVTIKNDRFDTSKKIIDAKKASYLNNDQKLSYIFLKDDLQYANINGQEVLLNEGACHLSYDFKNDLYYTSYYGAGLFKVIDNDKVIKTFSYGLNSHIHYAKYLPKKDLVGVVDLGLNKIYFYHNLTLKTTFEFDDNFGPRHFVASNNLPIIYVITELIPAVFVLKYQDGKWIEIQRLKLKNGAGSAIRITKDNKHLFTAVRESNLLYHFNILSDGTLILNEVFSTLGDHPRDFNLVLNDQYLVVANMNSNNLTLFKLINDKLELVDSNFSLPKGAAIISDK